MNVLIVEDEPLMAEELSEEILKADPTIRIVGKFPSVKETQEYLEENEMPDLFFSDIQLTDGLSFEIFAQIEKPIPVIFCTAFHDYALDAFKANGIDYLLKPFDNTAISKTINKYKQLIGDKANYPNLVNLFSQIQKNEQRINKSLIIHQGQKIYSVKYSDIRILYLKDGVLYLITEESKRYIVSSSLDRIEESLDHNFYRVNRQVIIHRDAIGYTSSYFARKLLITPKFNLDFELIVSKANASSFLKWLES